MDIGDTLDALVLDKVGYALDKLRLVDSVRDLGDDYLVAVALCLNYLGAGADYNLAAACAVGGADARSAHDYAAGREIGTGQISHKLLERRVGVIYQAVHGGNDLAQIVRRDIRRHTDRYTDGAVDKQIRISRRENRGLLESVVVVRDEIDRVFVDIRQHFERELLELRLGVTVSSGRVAVDGTEVSVAVNERISHGEVLRQTHHCVIDGGVAVRMVTAEHRTDRVRALTVRLVRIKTVFVHGIKYASVDGLQAVAHIGQSARGDDRHGVIQKGFAHFSIDLDIDYFLFVICFVKAHRDLLLSVICPDSGRILH